MAALPDRRSVLCVTGAALLASTPVAGTSASDVALQDGIYSPPSGSLVGSTFIITGANTGLGLESAKRLAAAGGRVVVTARSQGKVDGAVTAVRSGLPADASGSVSGVPLDLASLASVGSFPGRLATALGGEVDLDRAVLVNNAGVMGIPERLETADGFERTVGVNHLGHFALVAALLPTLRKARRGFRIINVSSDAHGLVDRNGMAAAIGGGRLEGAEYSSAGFGAYAISKAANILFADELQRRFDAAGLQASAVALNPGLTRTDLSRYVMGGVDAGDQRMSESVGKTEGVAKFAEGLVDSLIQPPRKGANTQVFLAAATDTGGDVARRAAPYYEKFAPSSPKESATDPELARQLWELSEKLTKTKLVI